MTLKKFNHKKIYQTNGREIIFKLQWHVSGGITTVCFFVIKSHVNLKYEERQKVSCVVICRFKANVLSFGAGANFVYYSSVKDSTVI